MEDLKDELGPFIDKFNEARLKTDRERNDKNTREDEFRQEFKSITTDRIKPIMAEYQTLLELKNQRCNIIIKPGPESYQYDDPMISMTVGFPNNYSNYSEITFSLQGESIGIHSNIRDPNGSGGSGPGGTYTKDQLTDEFIKEKLTSFVKDIYNKEWKSYSFPDKLK